jgi:hypothetical protein
LIQHRFTLTLAEIVGLRALLIAVSTPTELIIDPDNAMPVPDCRDAGLNGVHVLGQAALKASGFQLT